MFQEDGAAPNVKVRLRGGVRTALRNFWISFGVTLSLVCVSLWLWPFYPQGSDGRGANPREATQLMADTKARMDAGTSLPMLSIREDTWNRHFRDSLPQGKELKLSFDAERSVLVAVEQIGVIKFSTRIVFYSDDAGREPRVESLWRGHFPLPTRMVEGELQRIQEDFLSELDPRLWQELELVRMERGLMYLKQK